MIPEMNTPILLKRKRIVPTANNSTPVRATNSEQVEEELNTTTVRPLVIRDETLSTMLDTLDELEEKVENLGKLKT